MIKVNYPTNPTEKQQLENEYINILDRTNESQINSFLQNITYNSNSLTFRDLLTLKFEDLVQLINPFSTYLNTLSDPNKKRFLSYFSYDKNQPSIANFFTKQDNIDLQICHYCGLNFINSFKDLEDYFNGTDFINRAPYEDLIKIKGIGPGTANKILYERNTGRFLQINDSRIRLNQPIQSRLRLWNIDNTHSNFTLDHLLPQSVYKYYSLCLYNLVPSCYSCNSKFKKKKEFTINNNLKFISPTSAAYTFSNDFKFKLYKNPQSSNITSVNDFIIEKDIIQNNAHIEDYLRIFKIMGRYVYHKKEILDLITNKIKYPDSKIKNLSLQLGLPQKEIRKMIFGKELFLPSEDNKVLVKYKRDIAKDIKIKGVR